MTRAVELAQVASNGVSEAFKNRLINGQMVIDQRNAGASVSLASSGFTFSADRWYVENATDGTATVQQISDAPTGFSNSIRYTVTGTDTSLTSDQSAFVQQRIEGFNSSDLMFGTANASTITVSFWVKSSVTGTFGGALANNAYNRGYPFTYTISSANTWEQKSVTITGDTTGTWVGATNGIGLRLTFALAAGSARVSTAGAWAAYVGIGASGGTNLMATNSATWQITGVQLEVGSSATSFEYRPYGTELALCQRYCMAYRADASTNFTYFSIGNTMSSTESRQVFIFKQTMRGLPTVTTSATSTFIWDAAGGNVQVTGLSLDRVMTEGGTLIASVASSGLSANQCVRMIQNSTNTCFIIFSAEL